MKILAKNKKAYFNYKILEKFRAGIVLKGFEVKSIKSGRISLKGSYVVVKDEELFLIGATIPPYQPKNAPLNYNPERTRKLLLKKSQIKYLIGKSKQKGLTMIPLRVYTKKGNIKIEFGLAKGKKKADKRAEIKDKQLKRKIKRTLKEK